MASCCHIMAAWTYENWSCSKAACCREIETSLSSSDSRLMEPVRLWNAAVLRRPRIVYRAGCVGGRVPGVATCWTFVLVGSLGHCSSSTSHEEERSPPNSSGQSGAEVGGARARGAEKQSSCWGVRVVRLLQKITRKYNLDFYTFRLNYFLFYKQPAVLKTHSLHLL